MSLPRTSLCALVVVAWAAGGSAHAATTKSFVAQADRTQVPLDETFTFQVSLVVAGGSVNAYQAPTFPKFRILGEHPSQSHEIRMGTGGTFQQTVYSWTYELAPTQIGNFTIGAARATAGGSEIKTSPVAITVIQPSGVARPRPSMRSPFPRSMFGGGIPRGAPADEGPSGSFLRVVANKQRVFVGEQVVVEWRLYLTQRPDKYQPVVEPRTDGFWGEDLPIAANARGLALAQEDYEGRAYLAAPLFRKALFPLRAGKLTVTPFEADISQVDFFGTIRQTERLKADALPIEVVPLPSEGRPVGFDGAAVGTFAVEATVDRNRVQAGEAVTLTVTFSGQGNVRNVPVPDLAERKLTGFKLYDPKISVDVTPGDPVVGRKKIEYLLLPERSGTTTLEPFRLSYFDPQDRSYRVAETPPLTIEVLGGAQDVVGAQGGPSPSADKAGAAPSVENVLTGDLRPLRARDRLVRDLGVTLYRSRVFSLVLAAPPLALFGVFFAGRVRAQFGRETARGKNRRMRRQLRQRLGRAEGFLRDGNVSGLFIEIDHALRDKLTDRLAAPVTGLSREELRERLARSAASPALCDDVLAALDRCDQARFAPGSVGSDQVKGALENAGDLLARLDEPRPQVTGTTS